MVILEEVFGVEIVNEHLYENEQMPNIELSLMEMKHGSETSYPTLGQEFNDQNLAFIHY